MNRQGSRFEDRTAAFFRKTPWGSMGVKFFDHNRDGLMDLIVTDMHSDMTTAQINAGDTNLTVAFDKSKSDAWCAAEWKPELFGRATNSVFGNAFFQNQGSGHAFAEVSATVGTETYWPWGVTVADFNADGDEDVFVTAGMGYPLRYVANSLLLNDGEALRGCGVGARARAAPGRSNPARGLRARYGAAGGASPSIGEGSHRQCPGDGHGEFALVGGSRRGWRRGP